MLLFVSITKIIFTKVRHNVEIFHNHSLRTFLKTYLFVYIYLGEDGGEEEEEGEGDGGGVVISASTKPSSILKPSAP